MHLNQLHAKCSRIAVLCLALLPAGLAHSAATGADQAGQSDSSAKYFRELRRRGLFRLAESYCLEHLSHSGLSPIERADLTLELARTLAEHANAVSEPEQTELYDRSQAAIADFLKEDPQNPRRLLLEVQRAMLPASIAHARRGLAELQPYDPAARQRALDTLDTAVESLRAAEAQIAERIKKPIAVRGAAEGQLRPWELKSLLAHVRFRLGESLLDLAHLHVPGSAERVARLADAQKALKGVGESPDDGDLLWMSRVAFVECSRLLGDPDRTLREIEALEKLAPPPDIVERLQFERARVFLVAKKFRDASALFDQLESEQKTFGGELGFSQMQLKIAEWQADQEEKEAKLPENLRDMAKSKRQLPVHLLQALAERAARLNREVGGYWSARADLLIRQLQDTQQYGPELAALVERAKTAFNAGNSREAIELYGQATAKAFSDRRPELAFQLGFTRASIEIKAQSWVDAAADLQELAEQFPKNPKAAQAHLLAAFALGKSYDEKPTRARREEYTRVLEDHRKIYEGDPTASEATWMLAELDERRGQFTDSLELFKTIPRDHKRGLAAQVAVARIYEKILDRLRELKQPADEWEDDAVKTLSKMLPPVREGAPAWDIHQAEVAVRLARVLLRRLPPQFEPADRLLVRALKVLAASEPANTTTEAPPATAQANELRALALQLQVVSLAGQERFQDARTLLQKLSVADPAELLRILDGISPLESDDRKDPFHDLGALQLDAALKLNEHRAKLSAAEQRRLDECLARAYLATGEIRQGLKIYDALLQKNPRDKALLTSYAELLVKCGNKACLTKAVDIWRKLEALHEPGTAPWYPVRYELCRTLLLTGDLTESGKLLKTTRLVYPKPESETWQQKFAELEAEYEAARNEKAKR